MNIGSERHMIKKITLGSNCDIFVGNNILNKINLDFILDNKILIITDDIVWSIYKNKIKNIFKNFSIKVFKYVLKNGETQKNLDTVYNIYQVLAENNFIKTDYIVAFGGGVVGDIAGFVASTYMRSLNLINIPTTLLSQVDSSIGGKNGINLEAGKNLVGTIYNPQIIISDISFLKTLEKRQFFSGVAEIIKYCFIKDKALKDLIYNINNFNNLEEIVFRCINIKKQIVERDMFDRGERQILNFGHTIGHAIESIKNYQDILHGEAVSLGMLLITKIAIKNNLSSREIYNDLYKLLDRFNLPTKINIGPEKILNKIILDKKSSKNNISFIIVQDYEKVIKYELSKKDILNFFGTL